jgi:hypothetical protein
MFLYKLKNFWIKKNVKKSLSNLRHSVSNNSIKTIGIVIDESLFDKKEDLIRELEKSNITRSEIKIIVFREVIKKNESLSYSAFSYKDLNWNATFNNNAVNEFINTNFDLLISYYDVERGPLLQLTCLSKADFKVGFESVDGRLNQFMIATSAIDYKIFIQELIKYLKILNKL